MDMVESKGYISFAPLWAYLEKRKLNKNTLRNNGLNSRVIAKMTKNENVTIETIADICSILNCQPKDIMEFKKGEPNE